MKVLVTGATGNTGRHVVDGLKDAGAAVRVLVRDPAKAPHGVEVVQGDITDPAAAA
ncbi:MAG TPA: NAD(P)H-binding protein [Amycolatopsis sp.]